MPEKPISGMTVRAPAASLTPPDPKLPQNDNEKDWRSGIIDVPSTASTAIWNYGEFVLSRITRPGTSSPVLLLACAVAHPTAAGIARLEYAYCLRDELDSAWAARPLQLVRHHGHPALLVEDHG